MLKTVSFFGMSFNEIKEIIHSETVRILFVLCCMIGFSTVATAEQNQIFLRGKVISSHGSGKPIDSVIVRLLVAGQPVYSTVDGSFLLSNGKVVIDNHRRGLKPTQLLIRNGGILKPDGFQYGTTISLYDLQGKHLTRVVYQNDNKDQINFISNTAAKKSWSGNYILTVKDDSQTTLEYHLVTLFNNTIVGIGRGETGATLPIRSASSAAASVTDTLHLWKAGYKATKIALSKLTDSLDDITLDSLTSIQTAPAPLFRDPVCNGAADPTIIWNPQEKAYWIFYTNRRVNCCQGCTGVQWVFGTDIGITSSFDGGATWQYRGIAKLTGKKDLNWDQKKNTFWAVEVIYNKGLFHMYASITPGVLSSWNESIASIVHLTATDPLDGWSYDQVPFKSIHQGIDATVHKLGDGKWYLWGKFSDVMVSNDLTNWKVDNSSSPRTGEAPYVFYWKNYYWIIWDPTSDSRNGGLVVKRSVDGRSWVTQANILSGAGSRSGETGVDGKHCSVVIQKDKAYIVYFAEIGGKEGSCLQVAQLQVNNGILTANRDTPFEFMLEYYNDPANDGR
ncbi:MAG: family 43 glycosylhydrolase [Chitinispirillaceae bacterium]|nr:family 43 glycosylhydrolase [Chitinispirillaceae bacterium]